MKVYYDKLKFLLTDANGFFKSVQKEKDYWNILKFYVLLVALVQIVSFLIYIPSYLKQSNLLGIMGFGFIINIAASLIFPFIFSAVFYLGVLLFKGEEGYFNMFKVSTYSMAVLSAYGFVSSIIIGIISWFIPPDFSSILQGGNSLVYSLPVTIISGVIGFVGVIHFVYTLVNGMVFYQRLSPGKALASIIVIPIILTFIIGLIFGSGIALILNGLGY